MNSRLQISDIQFLSALNSCHIGDISQMIIAAELSSSKASRTSMNVNDDSCQIR